MSGQDEPLPEGEATFRAFLQRRTGFVIPEDRWRFLAPRFLSRLGDRGFKDVSTFVRYLEHDARGKNELEEIFNVLTVRKTSFFRNPACFAALEREVLPRIVAERRSRLPVALWSAGCSTGEEAYSLAMVANAVLRPHDLPFHLLASDIVKEALAKARQAAYPDAAFEDVPLPHRRWLKQSGGRTQVVDEVRNGVEFATHNLVFDAAPRPATGVWDVILCRNVLIYFGLKEAREVIDRFASVLAPGGVLVLGHAEVFMDLERDFEVVFAGDTFYYRRRRDTRVDPPTIRPESLRPLDGGLRGPLRPDEADSPTTTGSRAVAAAARAASAATSAGLTARSASDRLEAVKGTTPAPPSPAPPAAPGGGEPVRPEARDPLGETRRFRRPDRDVPTESQPRPSASSRWPTPEEPGGRRATSESGRWARPAKDPPDDAAPRKHSESGRWARPTKEADEPRAETSRKARLDTPTSRMRTASGDTPTRAFSRGWAPPPAPPQQPAPAAGGQMPPPRPAESKTQDPTDETRADLRVGAAGQPLPHDLVSDAERRLDADDREGAARALRAAITRAPRWGRPRVLLARLYLRQGETEHAQRQLEVAIEVEPLDPRGHWLLGTLRALQGDPVKAEASLRSALYLEPDLVPARYALARVYRDLARTDRAVKELRNVVRMLRTLAPARLAVVLDGSSAEELRERCEAEITTLGGSLDESGIFPPLPPGS